MKKFIIAVLLVLAISASVFAFAGCQERRDITQLILIDDENFAQYDSSTVDSDSGAHDLILQAYENWIASTNYQRDERFSFKAFNGKIDFATRETKLTRKIVGDKIYSQEIIVGTGEDTGSCAKKYYFDGTDAYESNFNAEDKGFSKRTSVTYNRETDEFTAEKWEDFVAFEGDVEQENYLYKDQLTTYNFFKKENLSDKHDDKIYKVGDTYYCSMTLNCTPEMMRTEFRVALDDFLNQTGAEEEGFKIKDDMVVFDFAIKEIDGAMVFVAWRRTEIYSGKYGGFLTINCEQVCESVYTYGNAEITAEDLQNLA